MFNIIFLWEDNLVRDTLLHFTNQGILCLTPAVTTRQLRTELSTARGSCSIGAALRMFLSNRSWRVRALRTEDSIAISKVRAICIPRYRVATSEVVCSGTESDHSRRGRVRTYEKKLSGDFSQCGWCSPRCRRTQIFLSKLGCRCAGLVRKPDCFCQFSRGRGRLRFLSSHIPELVLLKYRDLTASSFHPPDTDVVPQSRVSPLKKRLVCPATSSSPA